MSFDTVAAGELAKGDLAIEAKGLGKTYQIYARPQDRLWQMLRGGEKKYYREFAAVHGVDLAVRRGETIGIVGRNGSGKSTLLRLICGTLSKTSGSLDVRHNIAPLLTLGAGFNREFTGRENVFMNGAIAGLRRKEVEEGLDSIIEFADIGEFFDRPVKSYSSGMYSRLAFAVAVNSNPEILVVDEVLAVGDEAFTRKCFARIEEIKRSGSTILFVSHVAERVVELCDRAILMDGGECIYTAEPKAVVARYKQLIHAAASHAGEIRKEICTLNADEAIEPKGEREASIINDRGLVSKSRVDLASGGTQIENPRVTDREGNTVNQLQRGEIYSFRYEVAFAASASRVRFGMMLKPVSGLELGGQVSHVEGEGIRTIEAGARVEVHFRFRAALASGAYFMNAGVLGQSEGEERYLHRILDAMMFRVLPDRKSRVTGRVDLSVEGVEPEIKFKAN